MSTEAAFLSAIAAIPADDLPRLVFADWLDENGQLERAEFIRLELELARGIVNGFIRNRLVRRRNELFETNKANWIAPFPRHTAFVFRRSFIEECHTTADTFLARGSEWYSATPLLHVRLSQVDGCFERLFRSPLLAGLESFQLQGNQLTAEQLNLLFDRTDLCRLTELVLTGNPVRDEGAMRLAESSVANRLSSLHLNSCSIGDDGFVAIARSEHLFRLIWLAFRDNPITPDILDVIPNSELLRRVRRLDINCPEPWRQGIWNYQQASQFREWVENRRQ